MDRRFLTSGFVLLGLCLLGVGLAWNRLVPSRSYWGPEQAEEYAAAQIEAHSQSHQHGPNAEQKMALARERFANISQQLERARGSQRRTANVLLIAGMSFLVAGIGLHFTQSRSAH
jgi:hypothetical protein